MIDWFNKPTAKEKVYHERKGRQNGQEMVYSIVVALTPRVSFRTLSQIMWLSSRDGLGDTIVYTIYISRLNMVRFLGAMLL